MKREFVEQPKHFFLSIPREYIYNIYYNNKGSFFCSFTHPKKKQPKIGKKRKLDSFFAIQRTEPLERAKKKPFVVKTSIE
jgi:hypothetical protein